VKWRRIGFTHLTNAVNRGALSWQEHEGKLFLRHRNGTIYDFSSGGGMFMRRSHWNLLFQ